MEPGQPSEKAFEGGSLKRGQDLARAGSHAEALEEIDSYLKPHAKAAVSVEAVQAAAAAVRMANELALASMRDASSGPQLESSYAYLKWALKAPHASPALRAVTLNNAGIYYARNGNPDAALRCLERVGKQGGAVVEDDVSVHVMLNMTTVLADLGRHAEALEKAQDAVRALTRGDRVGVARADASLLSAAYHNLAVQQERLGNTRGHVRSYRAAVLQARKGGRKSAPMADFMTQAYSKARTRTLNQPTALGGMTNSLSSSPSSSGKTLLPPVGRQPRVPRGSAALPSGSKDASLSAASGLKRRKPGTGSESLVSVDDLYAGNTHAAPPLAAPLKGAPPIPPIRAAAQDTADAPSGKERGDQHAPRSAETATISSTMPAAAPPADEGAMASAPAEAETAPAETEAAPAEPEAAPAGLGTDHEEVTQADAPHDAPEPPPSPPQEAAPALPDAAPALPEAPLLPEVGLRAEGGAEAVASEAEEQVDGAAIEGGLNVADASTHEAEADVVEGQDAEAGEAAAPAPLEAS